jgi:hypothetical protein
MARRFVPPDVAVRFVMQAPPAERARLLAEGVEDVLLVAYDDDASRSAWYKQWVWLAFAARAFPNATHIVRAEDDTYLNLGTIRRSLASDIFRRDGSAGALHLAGGLEAFSWLPSLGCPVGWAPTLDEAAQSYQAACGTAIGQPCFGPFVFAGAYVVALSLALVHALLASGAAAEAADLNASACPREAAARWRAQHGLWEKHLTLRKCGDVLSDDVWLGYAIRRHLSAARLSFVG